MILAVGGFNNKKFYSRTHEMDDGHTKTASYVEAAAVSFFDASFFSSSTSMGSAFSSFLLSEFLPSDFLLSPLAPAVDSSRFPDFEPSSSNSLFASFILSVTSLGNLLSGFASSAASPSSILMPSSGMLAI